MHIGIIIYSVVMWWCWVPQCDAAHLIDMESGFREDPQTSAKEEVDHSISSYIDFISSFNGCRWLYSNDYGFIQYIF